MKTNYRIVFTVAIEKLIPSAGKIINDLNDFMNNIGFPEKLTVRSELPFTLTTDRPLTHEEEVKMVSLMSNELNKLHPEWNPEYKSFELCN